MTAEVGEDVEVLWSKADLVTPMALRVAATLEVADRIREGLGAASEIGLAVGVESDALERVLRHLASIGVFHRDDSGRYSLTGKGDALCDDHPSGLRRRLDINGAIGRADLSFVHLLHSVMTGDASFPVLYGRSFWDDLAADEERTASYDWQMGSDVGGWAPQIVSGYDWASLGNVVDVGGGDGSLLVALLMAYPNLRGVVVDQPATADTARANLAASGLTDRCDAVAGSFFEPLPSGADGYILSAVLHDWDDDDAGIILSRCAEAAGSNGSVFVIERTGADGESPSTEMDLRMLAYFGARERGVTQIIAIAAAAGLELVAAHRLSEISMIELAQTQA